MSLYPYKWPLSEHESKADSSDNQTSLRIRWGMTKVNVTV